MLQKCPLKEPIATSEEGTSMPCEVCNVIKHLANVFTELEAKYKEIRKEYLEIKRSHWNCAGCGLCFGGKHIAIPNKIEGLGDVCQWCKVDIDKYGLASFMKRIKHSTGEKEC